MLQEGGFKADSLSPFQVPFLFLYGRGLWMELMASFDVTPFPQLIGALLDLGWSVWMSSDDALPWASFSPPTEELRE